MLKCDWEKTDQLISIDKHLIEEIARKVIPKKKLKSFEVISGGCVNLNIKLCITKAENLILRIYLRKKDIVYKEKNILNLLNGKVPVPRILYVGELEKYQFSIMEYIDGISLNKAIISNMGDDFSGVMYDLGKALGELQDFHFKSEGDLSKDLEVIPYGEGDNN